MLPPFCAVCDAEVTDGGGTVTFAARPSDRAWREQAEREVLVGHPPDTAWLCAEHAPSGRALALTVPLDQALSLMRTTSPVDRMQNPAESGDGVEIAVLLARLTEILPEIARDLGLDSQAVAEQTRRDWTPVDRTVPPYSPYTETTTRSIDAPDTSIRLVWEQAFWNPDEIARASITLTVRVGTRPTHVTACPAHGSTRVRSGDIVISGDLPGPIERTLVALSLMTG